MYLQVALLGDFSMHRAGGAIDLKCRKVQELFCYLLLHRQRPITREVAATMLWPDSRPSQSRAYLRRALWQLRASFKAAGNVAPPVTVVDTESIQCNPEVEFWVDVDVLEQAFEATKCIPGQELTDANAHLLEQAVEVYDGDLLESYPQDWCLYPRERLRYLYLEMLEKLTVYHQSRQHYPKAIATALRSLSHDRTREQTYRQLMLLHYKAGQRTEALRQYETCARVLQDYLSVSPSDETHTLMKQIRADEVIDSHYVSSNVSTALNVHRRLESLDQALAEITQTHMKILHEMKVLRSAIHKT